MKSMIVEVGWLMLLLATAANEVMSSQTNQPLCIPKERQALLTFKQTLNDTDDDLSSWTNRSADQNCCNWNRITCDSQTNHVISIGTRGIYTIGGDLDASLAELQHLNHLDLRGMNIRRIPKFIGSLKELTYLDLAGNNISVVPKFIGSLKELTYLGLEGNPVTGIIPLQLGNLTKLQTLDLSSTSQMSIDNDEWLSHLTSLKTLSLSNVNFTAAEFQSLKWAPSLSSLFISNCLLPKVDISFLSHTNDSFHFLQSLGLYDNYIHPLTITWLLNSSVHLTRLSLMHNIINGSFPNSFEQTKSLQFVDLSSNDVGSGVPKSLGNLTNLEELDLSSNNLGGTLPDLLKNLSGSTKNSLKNLELSSNQLGGLILDDFENIFQSLKWLHLDNNQLEGPFLSGLKRFPSLESLDLDDNNLTGVLPDLSSMPNLRRFSASNNRFNRISSESIGKLDYLDTLDISSNSLIGVISEVNLQCPKLEILDLSYNSALKFNSNWIPSFQLLLIYMSSCNLGPEFPSWIQTQTSISLLDISNNAISGPIPSWFTNITSSLNYLNMSPNNLSSTLPNFPLSSPDDIVVDLSFNQFQGFVPPSLSINATNLFLSNNAFTEFRSFLCGAKEESKPAKVIDLSHNYLSGNLSDCWESFRSLIVLNLGYNMLSGHIPSSINMTNIVTLQLRHNNFSGTLPSSLEDNTSLQVLDLTNNTLEGTIPPWIGEKTNLVFLSLRSNKFYGRIPMNLCHLTQIQILDLSLNDLSGAIPSCIRNFTAMVQIMDYQETTLSTIIPRNASLYRYNHDGGYEFYENIASITWKGAEREYDKILGLLRIIDLSRNKLNGEIPIEVTDLSQLIQLNLSRNNLSGRIPKMIGSLTNLQVLDLSHNKLYGPIPTSLAKVSFLSYLDLSYNQLSGRIPDGGTQLQTFNASIYSMNPGLCGPPLSSSCPGDETLHDPSYSAYDNEGDDENGGDWLDLPWFYKGTGVGFIIGFCGICGNLLINTSWRLSYFKLMHEIGDWLYVIIIVKWAVLRRKLSLH